MTADAAPPRPGLAWDNRDTLGYGKALLATVKGVLLEPGPSFGAMRRDGGVGGPLLFAVFLGTLGSWAALIWQTLLSFLLPTALTANGLEMLGTVVSLVVTAVLMPALIVFQLFMIAGLVHLLLLVFDGGQHGFEATFRTIAYAYGGTAPLNLLPIPYLAPLVAWVWHLVAAIVGLGKAHETAGWKAAAAVLLPLGVCCVCICVGIGVALALGVSAVGMN